MSSADSLHTNTTGPNIPAGAIEAAARALDPRAFKDSYWPPRYFGETRADEQLRQGVRGAIRARAKLVLVAAAPALREAWVLEP